MGYAHAKVSDIEETTGKVVEREGQVIPTPECSALAKLISKVYPNAMFGVCARSYINNGIASSMVAYMPGDEYAMCEFGYRDVAVGDDKKINKYFIYYRNINNEKYHPSRDQHHMVTSDSLDRMFGHVKKYVRPYSPIEMARLSFKDFAGAIGSTRAKVTQSEEQARDNLLHSGGDGMASLREELFGMLDRGYEFSNPIVKEQVIAWRQIHQEYKAVRETKKHAYYVQVRMIRDEQMFEIFELFDVVPYSRSFDVDAQAVMRRKADDLPDDVAGKLAALSMLPNKHYVEGVGMKVSDASYWVERS